MRASNPAAAMPGSIEPSTWRAVAKLPRSPCERAICVCRISASSPVAFCRASRKRCSLASGRPKSQRGAMSSPIVSSGRTLRNGGVALVARLVAELSLVADLRQGREDRAQPAPLHPILDRADRLARDEPAVLGRGEGHAADVLGLGGGVR